MQPQTKIQYTLEAGRVARYHATPSVSTQSVAAHSWGVAVLLLHIFPDCSKGLLKEALLHDTEEYWTGDIPYHFKRDCPEAKELSERMGWMYRSEFTITTPYEFQHESERQALKLCDTLEGLLWCANNERGSLITDRWRESYNICKEKFHLITPEQWRRAEEVLHQLPFQSALL